VLRDRSTHRGRFSDEPFGVRDVQFDRPRILVEPCATREEIPNVGGTRRVARSGELPAIAAVDVQNPFETGKMSAPAADQQEQRSAISVAPLQHRRKAAVASNSAQDRAGLDVRWKPLVAQAASNSSAPMSKAARASRLRAPRRRSRVPASRVTRLIDASAFR
jgi:hypothetical protein